MGGILSSVFGGKRVLLWGVALWSLFTFSSALFANNFNLLILMRMLLGMSEGVGIPVVYNFVSKWIPPQERSRAITFCLSGSYLGTLTSMYFSSFLIVSSGWRYVFYICSIFGFSWCLFWQYFATDSPSSHSSIHVHERVMLESLIGSKQEYRRIPWAKLLTNYGVWAIVAGQVTSNWAFYILLTWTPTFFSSKLNVKISRMGVYTVLPYTVMFITTILGGSLADHLIRRKMSLVSVRRFMETLEFVSVLFLLCLGNVTNPNLAVFMISMALGFLAFGAAGHMANVMDIAPEYASILNGFTTTFATLPGVIGIPVTGWLLTHNGENWSQVFDLSAVILFMGALLFIIFSKGEKQIE